MDLMMSLWEGTGKRAGARRRRAARSRRPAAFRIGLERLEDLTLLSAATLKVDPAVADKVGGDLAYLFADSVAASTATDAPKAGVGTSDAPLAVASDQPNAAILQVIGDRVVVDSVAQDGDTDALAAELAGLGAEVTGAYGRMVSSLVPIPMLGALAALPDVLFARAAYEPMTAAGNVDGQAVPAMKADVGGARFGVDGTGVTVGILSDSFNVKGGYATDVSRGDLPSGVVVLQEGPSGSTDEGRGMAQLVHDVAPGSPLAFSSAFLGEASFAQGIRNLAKPVAQGGAGAKVVTDDVFYFDEPMFQDGVVAQAINAVVASGASYFSSAGNFARKAYQSAFNPATTTTNLGRAGVAHNFNPGGAEDIFQPVSIPAGATFQISFQWDQPYASQSTAAPGTAGSQSDVDIYLVNSTKSAVLASGQTSNVGRDPVEIFSYTNSGTTTAQAYLLIKSISGPRPGTMKYVLLGGGTVGAYQTNTGASFGHNMAAGSAGVAAAAYSSTPAYGVSPAVKESFSSSGGTAFLFDPAGNRLATPDLRPQPRFTAIDGTDTSFFGGDADGNGLPNFFGTSAAAPDAAAVAALLKQAVPSLTADQIYAALQSSALDMAAPGYDADTGYGLIQADRALALVAGAGLSGTAFQDGNGDGTRAVGEPGQAGVTVFFDANGNGQVDAGTATFTATAGLPLGIPDGSAGNPSRVASALAVSGLTGRVTKVTVALDITHSYDGDLGATLISPSGIRIPLFTHVGGSGHNFTGTTFDDGATVAIASAAVPFGGTFRPQVALAGLVGEAPNGTWTLEARDYAAADTGTLNAWSLTIAYADPSTTTDGSGRYAFTGLAPGSTYGPYVVRAVLPAGYRQSAPGSLSYNVSPAIGSQATGLDFGLVPPTVAIVDDSGPGFATTGQWSSFPSSASVGGGGRYHLAGDGSSAATWTTSGLAPGTYRVSATWLAYSDRAADAPFTVLDGVTPLATVALDQRAAPDGFLDAGAWWRDLGVFTITGSTLAVRLTDAGHGLAIADAIRAEPINGPLALLSLGAAPVGDARPVDFGAALVGAPVARTFTVRNAGVAPLTLGAVSLPSGFSLAAAPGATTLAPGASTTFTVRMDAAAAGSFSGTVSIATNDAARGPLRFGVTGVASAAYVVDDSGAGFATTGQWEAFPSSASVGGGGRYHLAGDGTSAATWTLSGLTPGTYRVSATWLAYSDRAPDAPFTVLDGSTPLATVAVDQRSAPADRLDAGAWWRDLGVFTVTGSTLAVRLTDAGHGVAIADAIRVERVS